jgi:hypothetical protein
MTPLVPGLTMSPQVNMPTPKAMTRRLRCDECGRVIPWKDLEIGAATRTFITPDSMFSSEEYETLCRRHANG